MGRNAPLIKGYIMDRNIEKYLKVYQVLSEKDCIETVKALEEKDKEFQTHQFYNSTEGTYHSYEHELSVAYSQRLSESQRDDFN